MIKLDAGNVRLTPSHRRLLTGWLKRALRLGNRVGGLLVHITLHRVGKVIEARASVHDRIGDFACRTRRSGDVRGVFRELGRVLAARLHDQRLGLVRAV